MKKVMYIIGFLVLLVILIVFGFVCSWTNEAASVVYDEVRPQELLRKYEWFKDVTAQLDAKNATIKVYTEDRKELLETYGDPKGWPRDVRDEAHQSKMEIKGIVASYNLLAADYNAQMAKWNWQFCNVGTLPKGATEPLPREFAAYKEK